MSLRAALERTALGTRHEREAAAGLLRKELEAMARSLGPGHPDAEDAVQELTAYFFHQCLDGVPRHWPTDDRTLGNYLFTSLQRWLAGRKARLAREVSLELPDDDAQRTNAERPELSQEADRQTEHRHRKDLGGMYLGRALALVPPLAKAVIAARMPRFRKEAVATWNAMVEVYAGTDLDQLIARGGRTSDKAERERWYTRFKNFRHALFAKLEEAPLSPDDRELVGHFIQQCLTHRGQLSDLRDLQIISGEEDVA